MQELLRTSLQAEQPHPKPIVKPMRPNNAAPPQPTEEPSDAVAPGTPMRQLRLIFASDVADIPAGQVAELVSSIKQIQAPLDTDWKIWSNVLSSDPVMERAAYRLMLIVRKALIAQGVPEKQIDLKLKLTKALPPRFSQGEIVIHVAPLHLMSSEKRSP
jgi:hypothetical protein